MPIVFDRVVNSTAELTEEERANECTLIPHENGYVVCHPSHIKYAYKSASDELGSLHRGLCAAHIPFNPEQLFHNRDYAESMKKKLARTEVRYETPLDALKRALSAAGIAYDPTRLDNNRDYYELKQSELSSLQREKARLAGNHNTNDPIDKSLLELQIAQRVLEALRPVKPGKRLSVLRAASLLLLGKDIVE